MLLWFWLLVIFSSAKAVPTSSIIHATSTVDSIISKCTNLPPGTYPMKLDQTLTYVQGDLMNFVATSNYVQDRHGISMYLGLDDTLKPCQAVLQDWDSSTCSRQLILVGNYSTDFFQCNWNVNDTDSDWTILRNTLFLKWTDSYPDSPVGNKTTTIKYPVTIKLPKFAQGSSENTTISSETGMENLQLTGVSYTNTVEGRFLLIDYQVWTQWPHNLEFVKLIPPFKAKQPFIQNPFEPNCGNLPFNTTSKCWQSATIAIPLNSSTCNVGGDFLFKFASSCFPSNTTTCTSQMLNRTIEIADQDICIELGTSISSVQATLSTNMDNYQFGQPILISVNLDSNGIPIQQTQLESLIAYHVKQDLNISLFDRSNTIDGRTLVGINSKMIISDGQLVPTTINVSLTPNMGTSPENAMIFLTDADSSGHYVFSATFRVYFSSNSTSKSEKSDYTIPRVHSVGLESDTLSLQVPSLSQVRSLGSPIAGQDVSIQETKNIVPIIASISGAVIMTIIVVSVIIVYVVLKRKKVQDKDGELMIQEIIVKS